MVTQPTATLTADQLNVLVELANRAPKTAAESYALTTIVASANAQLAAQQEQD